MNSKLTNIKIIFLTLALLKLLLNVPEIKAITFADIRCMEKLTEMQARLIDVFVPQLQFIQCSRQKRIVTKFVRSLEVEHSIAKKNVTHYLSNPINAFRLVKRLYLDLNFVENASRITFSDSKYENKSLLSLKSLRLSVDAINNLINYYNLSVEDLSNGTLKVPKRLFYPEARSDDFFIDKVTPLASIDCFFLVSTAIKNKDYLTAQRWIDEARRKFYDECDGDCPVDLLDFSVLQEYLVNQSKNSRDTDEKVNELCTGEHYQKGLTCQYRYGPHPFLRLARFKTESLHKDSDVTMFHDVISDEEIAMVKNLSLKSNISAAVLGKPKSEIRQMCQISLLPDEGNAKLRNLYQRTLDISERMGDTFAEPWYVAHYGPGGFYKQHLDSDKKYTSARNSTVIFYLSNVDIGGATAFKYLELSVHPQKYSALHWRNIIPETGAVDRKTKHEGCPLIYGSKWVLIKWLSDFIQPVQSVIGNNNSTAEEQKKWWRNT